MMTGVNPYAPVTFFDVGANFQMDLTFPEIIFKTIQKHHGNRRNSRSPNPMSFALRKKFDIFFEMISENKFSSRDKKKYPELKLTQTHRIWTARDVAFSEVFSDSLGNNFRKSYDQKTVNITLYKGI